MIKTDEKVRRYRKSWHKEEVRKSEGELGKENQSLQQQGQTSFIVIHHETRSGIMKTAECQVAKSPII